MNKILIEPRPDSITLNTINDYLVMSCDLPPLQRVTIRDGMEPTVSLWTDVQRLRELIVVFLVALIVGAGLGTRRERKKWTGRF